MKKNFMWLAAVFSVAVMFSSCDKPDEEGNGNGNGNHAQSDAVYDAEAQKTRLQDIALELMGKFNPDDQRQAVELADYLVVLYEDYDWDFSEVEDHYKEDYDFLFSVNRDIAHGEFMPKFATDLLLKAAGRKTYIYKFADIDAEWEADEEAHVWKYKGKGNGGLVLKFKGPDNVVCEAKLTGEDSDISYSGTHEIWDDDIHGYRDVEFEGNLPKKVNFYLKEGSTELANLEMSFDVQKSDRFNYDFTTKITNITIAGGVKITKHTAACVYSVKRNNENLIKAVADLKGFGLIDKADYQDWVDYWEMYADMWEERDLHLGTAVAQVDILDGKLTIKTATTDGEQFVKDCDALEEKYDALEESDKPWFERYYHQAPYNKDWAALLNKFMTVDMYYGDSKGIQAQMTWDAYYDDRTASYWDNNGEYQEVMYMDWGYMPMIYFPADKTSYNFGKYFTEKTFNKVINSAEDLINSYIHLSKRWGEGVEFEF